MDRSHEVKAPPSAGSKPVSVLLHFFQKVGEFVSPWMHLACIAAAGGAIGWVIGKAIVKSAIGECLR